MKQLKRTAWGGIVCPATVVLVIFATVSEKQKVGMHEPHLGFISQFAYVNSYFIPT